MRFKRRSVRRLTTDRDLLLTFYIRTRITVLKRYEDPSLWHHEQLGAVCEAVKSPAAAQMYFRADKFHSIDLFDIR